MHDLSSADARDIPRSACFESKAPTALGFLLLNLPGLMGYGTATAPTKVQRGGRGWCEAAGGSGARGRGAAARAGTQGCPALPRLHAVLNLGSPASARAAGAVPCAGSGHLCGLHLPHQPRHHDGLRQAEVGVADEGGLLQAFGVNACLQSCTSDPWPPRRQLLCLQPPAVKLHPASSPCSPCRCSGAHGKAVTAILPLASDKPGGPDMLLTASADGTLAGVLAAGWHSGRLGGEQEPEGRLRPSSTCTLL